MAAAEFSRGADENGWYNHPVRLTFSGSAFSRIAYCTSPLTYGGPDTSGTTLGGSCVDNAGKVANTTTAPFRYDATPPAITGWHIARRPDHHGWYNHPVRFTFSGTDATSGLDYCTSPTYAGPDSANASAVGACRDKAGNVAYLGVPLKYDSTPPCLGAGGEPGDTVVFVRTLACAHVRIVRSPGLRGKKSSTVHRGDAGTFTDRSVRNGVRYTYTITSEDQAGNIATRTVSVIPGARLLSPAVGARLVNPPRLVWTTNPRASYYNVQLYRGKKKILSIWPGHARLQLPKAWKYAGRRYGLKPAQYRWYVWPGFGRRSAGRYGSLIGSGTFVIVKPGV